MLPTVWCALSRKLLVVCFRPFADFEVCCADAFFLYLLRSFSLRVLASLQAGVHHGADALFRGVLLLGTLDCAAELMSSKTTEMSWFRMFPRASSKEGHFLRYLRGFRLFSDSQILSNLRRSKSVLGSVFEFLTKI